MLSKGLRPQDTNILEVLSLTVINKTCSFAVSILGKPSSELVSMSKDMIDTLEVSKGISLSSIKLSDIH